MLVSQFERLFVSASNCLFVCLIAYLHVCLVLCLIFICVFVCHLSSKEMLMDLFVFVFLEDCWCKNW